MHQPTKIISGGQTGADIGGLVGAKLVGIETGGCAPKGYKTEKGDQEEALMQFGLVAHPSANYRDRTKENVLNSDATLIIATDPASDGTQLTIEYCKIYDKPYLMIDPDSGSGIDQIKVFIEREKPTVLNVAGNRESKSPGLSAKTVKIIEEVFGK